MEKMYCSNCGYEVEALDENRTGSLLESLVEFACYSKSPPDRLSALEIIKQRSHQWHTQEVKELLDRVGPKLASKPNGKFWDAYIVLTGIYIEYLKDIK